MSCESARCSEEVLLSFLLDVEGEAPLFGPPHETLRLLRQLDPPDEKIPNVLVAQFVSLELEVGSLEDDPIFNPLPPPFLLVEVSFHVVFF